MRFGHDKFVLEVSVSLIKRDVPLQDELVGAVCEGRCKARCSSGSHNDQRQHAAAFAGAPGCPCRTFSAPYFAKVVGLCMCDQHPRGATADPATCPARATEASLQTWSGCPGPVLCRKRNGLPPGPGSVQKWSGSLSHVCYSRVDHLQHGNHMHPGQICSTMAQLQLGEEGAMVGQLAVLIFQRDLGCGHPPQLHVKLMSSLPISI